MKDKYTRCSLFQGVIHSQGRRTILHVILFWFVIRFKQKVFYLLKGLLRRAKKKVFLPKVNTHTYAESITPSKEIICPLRLAEVNLGEAWAWKREAIKFLNRCHALSNTFSCLYLCHRQTRKNHR